MIKTPFKLTKQETLASAGATLLLLRLDQSGAQRRSLSDVCEKPQYGFTASASWQPVGPRFVRITDVKGGAIGWDDVPFCECAHPEPYILRHDDILVARSGSVGKSFLVESVPDPAVFASYMIRLRARPALSPGYIYWCLQSQQFWQQIMASRRGSAMKNVNGQMLGALQFPWPEDSTQKAIVAFLNAFRARLEGKDAELPPLPHPLDDQRRVVAKIEQLAAKVEEARLLRGQAEAEAEAFTVSVHIHLSGEQIRKIGELLTLDEDAVAVSPTGAYPQVGVRSFGGGLFPKAAVAGTDTTYKSFNRLYEDALLLSQVKGWEGAVAVCPSELVGWYASPEYRTFRCIPTMARPGYLAPLIRTEWFWSTLSNATRGVGARRERTRPEQFLDIELPMPNLEEQKRGESLFGQVDSLRRMQAETTATLNTLMPSILSKAFAGEL